MQEIILSVAAERGQPVAHLLIPPNKTDPLVRARWDAMTRLRAMPFGGRGRPPSTTQIAAWMNCDHTSVINGLRRWAEITQERVAA